MLPSPAVNFFLQMNSLPQELIDYIIDILEGDKSALSACSLVTPSWTHSTRRHLFNHISYTTCPGDKIPIPQNLFDFLLSSPTICTYIHSLHLCGGDHHDSVKINLDVWCGVLGALPSLEDLYLESLSVFPHIAPRSSVPSRTNARVLQLTDLYLEEIYLCGENQFLTLLQLLQPISSVQHLLIDNIYSEYDDDERFPEFETDILGPLEKLDLPTDIEVDSVTMYGFRNASALFIMTFLKAQPSTIRSFQLESLSMDSLDMSTILDEMMSKSVGPGLQSLTIDVGRDGALFQECVEITGCTSLHSLRFIMHQGPFWNHFNPTIRNLSAPPPVAFNLIYEFRFPPERVARVITEQRSFNNKPEWGELQTEILKFPVPPTALSLEFKGGITHHVNAGIVIPEEELRQELSILDARGLLSIQVV